VTDPTLRRFTTANHEGAHFVAAIVERHGLLFATIDPRERPGSNGQVVHYLAPDDRRDEAEAAESGARIALLPFAMNFYSDIRENRDDEEGVREAWAMSGAGLPLQEWTNARTVEALAMAARPDVRAAVKAASSRLLERTTLEGAELHRLEAELQLRFLGTYA
jgi:hypothetical protein